MIIASSLGILARRSVVTGEVGSAVAAEASLRFQILRFAISGITDEHTEALYPLLEIGVVYGSKSLTGLKAVTWPLPPET